MLTAAAIHEADPWTATDLVELANMVATDRDRGFVICELARLAARSIISDAANRSPDDDARQLQLIALRFAFEAAD